MAKISVITPTNSVEWFLQAKKSLLWQTEQDWEWIVLFNGNAWHSSDDPRIKCIPTQVGLPNVGALKREACTHVTSPYCVEFDHDDELDRTCLEKVLKAFAENDVVFVYSDGAHVRSDGTPVEYRGINGWSQKTMKFHGEKEEELVVNERPLLLPQNVSRIWFAPDHVRAWKMDAYVLSGGHQSHLRVCDDQDLMARLWKFSGGRFYHIPECLYKYRVHGDNTYLVHNAEIQSLCHELHDANIEDMAFVYWRRQGLGTIDLGGAISKPAGWTSCDTHDADIIADLTGEWPFKDDSVGIFRAHDIIEHLPNIIHTMNEAYRCLCHGGILSIEVPSTDGRGAFADPSHVSFFNQTSWRYYCDSESQKYIRHLGIKCRFQLIRSVTYYPNQWCRDNKVDYCRAHLVAIKDGPRLHGLIEI